MVNVDPSPHGTIGLTVLLDFCFRRPRSRRPSLGRFEIHFGGSDGMASRWTTVTCFLPAARQLALDTAWALRHN